MTKICEMKGVRGGDDGLPVNLVRDNATGRLLITAYNEGGYSSVDIDLEDLMCWIQKGPKPELLPDGYRPAFTITVMQSLAEQIADNAKC